jgi:5-methylcytosine-specific restriction endonuclease McrA
MDRHLAKFGHEKVFRNTGKNCLICRHIQEARKRKENGLGLSRQRAEYHLKTFGHEKVNRRGKSDCLICHRDREIRRARIKGVLPAKRLTREEKLTQRRKWENDRRAKKKANFVETVDPMIVYERDSGICQICLESITDKWEVDHFIPLARGGEHSYANSQLAHPSCNRKKWANLPATA